MNDVALKSSGRRRPTNISIAFLLVGKKWGLTPLEVVGNMLDGKKVLALKSSL